MTAKFKIIKEGHAVLPLDSLGNPIDSNNPLPVVDSSLISSKDPWIEHAKQVIFADYGVNVTLEAKDKDLLKFGESRQVQTTKTTLMTLPSGTFNETYVSTNIITSIVSTSASDTESVVIEGHTISGGVFTFVTQKKSLTGQTAATLGTALARCSRIYNEDGTELAGTVSVCETDTYSSGVPQTPAGVHAQIFLGDQQSLKASTTLSNVDYWVVTSFYGDYLEKAAGFSQLHLEIRLVGKVFRHVVIISATDGGEGRHPFKPYLIVPPNADIRIRATAAANGKEVSGGIEGALLKA